MYAAGRIVGKSERRNKILQGRNSGIKPVKSEFGGWDTRPGVVRTAFNLYEHIIFLDGARGECYGREKSQR
jgi:hypothetical protein